MLVSGLSFGAGVILMAAAQEIGMLIVGRILLGVGVGFAIQVGGPCVRGQCPLEQTLST